MIGRMTYDLAKAAGRDRSGIESLCIVLAVVVIGYFAVMALIFALPFLIFGAMCFGVYGLWRRRHPKSPRLPLDPVVGVEYLPSVAQREENRARARGEVTARRSPSAPEYGSLRDRLSS